MGEDAGSGSMAWLGTKVPMWALMVAVLGTGATAVGGGSWRWLENNEPRMVELSSRAASLERELATFKSDYQREHQQLRLDVEKAATSLQVQMATKVDNATRIEMLNNLNVRLDQIERHMESIDARIAVLAIAASVPPRDRK